jgi:hypothetical protein
MTVVHVCNGWQMGKELDYSPVKVKGKVIPVL